jgi:2-keto-4-pentenoate hydratase/2-oxohepta-3-ene-1,7-dioic acid hydratase in catechol pathway
VLPGARVICIGLNFLKNVAEGSYASAGVPEHPTLFARWTVQRGRTDEMVYTVGDTLSLVSRTCTLRPGDLLATGTPSGVGYSRTPPWLLQPGDVVEVEVDKLGTLTNPVVGNDVWHAEFPGRTAVGR